MVVLLMGARKLERKSLLSSMSNYTPTRVLHMTLSFEHGGRREVIRSLMKHLPSMGVECDLCCLNELGDAAEEAPDPIVLSRRSLFDFRAISRLRSFCLDRGIQVIHAHDAASQFTAGLVRLANPNIRLIMTFHRSLNFESATISDRVRNGLANSLSAAVVVLSNERRQHYIHDNFIRESKVLLIPNGVDTSRFAPDEDTRLRVRRDLGVSSECVVFGAIGHYGNVKGIDVVLRAWKAFQSRNAGANSLLVVLGKGNESRRSSFGPWRTIACLELFFWLGSGLMCPIIFARATPLRTRLGRRTSVSPCWKRWQLAFRLPAPP